MFCPNPDCPDVEELGEPGEFLAEVTECPVCGTALTAAPPDWADHQPRAGHDRLVPVLAVANPALLPLAKSILQDAGLRFSVRNEEVQDLIGWGRLGTGFNVATGPPEVLVDEADLEQARELLLDLSRAGEADD